MATTAAEVRLAELEAIERDLRAAPGTWKDWEGALDADPVLARQLLRKALAGPISVSLRERGHWTNARISRFDGCCTARSRRMRQSSFTRGLRPAARWSAAIAGGGAPSCGIELDRYMAPHTPQRSERPGEPVALLYFRGC